MAVIGRFPLLIMLMASVVQAAQGPPARQLDMERAVEIAMGSHAALQAAAVRVRSTAGLELQAGLRPNPEFSFQTENWRSWGTPDFSASRDLDIFAYVSQPIEARGKRARRLEVSTQERRLAELELKALQWRIRQGVRQAFLRALAAQRQLSIMRESGRNLDQVVEYHQIRVAQGAMAEADLIRVRLERERLAFAESAAAVDADRGRADLLKAMGVTGFGADFELVDASAPQTPGTALTLQNLLQQARAGRAEILLAEAGVERARAQAGFERAQSRPDLAVIAGYKRTADNNTLLGGVSIPLPFFNRNQGNILLSETEIERVEKLKQALVAEVEADIQAALMAVRRRRAMLGEMEKGMVGRAEESWRISIAAYQEGGADLLRLLDAQRVRNEVQQLLVRTQMEYRLSLAELESAAGVENIVLSEELLRVAP